MRLSKAISAENPRFCIFWGKSKVWSLYFKRLGLMRWCTALPFASLLSAFFLDHLLVHIPEHAMVIASLRRVV
jgi:hypothetical protein